MNIRALLVAAASALTMVSESVAAPIAYQRFPDIPRSSVEPNAFIESFRTTCAAFEKRCAAPSADDAERCSTEPGSIDNAARQFASLDADAPPARKVFRYVWVSLHQACSAIAAGKPLTDAQLEEVRRLRDKPKLQRVLPLVAAGTDPEEAWRDDAGEGAGPALTPDLPGFEGPQGRLIVGLADFITRRTKQQALAFLTKTLHDELCKSDVEQFYPATCAAIGSTDSTRSLATIRATLRASVQLDLDRLPDFSLAYLLATRNGAKVKNFALAGRIALAYADGLGKQRSPLELAWSIGELPRQSCEVTSECSGVGHAARFASALFYAAAQGGEVWTKTFRELEPRSKAGAPKVALSSLALVLLAEARWIATDDARPIPIDVINAFVQKPTHFWLAILELHDHWTDAVERVKRFTQAADRQALYAESARRSFDTLSELVSASLPIVSSSSDAGELSVAVREVALARADIARAQYAPAIAHFTLALRQALPPEAPRPSPPASLPGDWSRHLGLLVEIAEAESSEEVSAALDDYAAPLGAYATKYRLTRVALNGMLGVWGGGERLATHGVSGTSGALGFSTPVGLHITTPVGRNGEDNSFHLGLSLSVIDLGALTTYRLDGELDGDADGATTTPADADAEAEQAPVVGLEQVLSPGAFVTLGLFGSPVVLGAGVSVSPRLRRVSDDGAEFEASALRLGVFLGVDIPIVFAL
jgi:hypothetical protein